MDRLNFAERDTLYEGKVNPIAAFPGQGIVAFGQKTLQRRSSALDRVNDAVCLLHSRSSLQVPQDSCFLNKMLYQLVTVSLVLLIHTWKMFSNAMVCMLSVLSWMSQTIHLT